MTKHGLLWLAAILLIFIFAPLFLTHKIYTNCIETEIASARTWYNDKSVDSIVSRANSIYGLLLVSTGVDPVMREHLALPPLNGEISPGVELPAIMSPYANHLMEYWSNVLLNIWMFCFRLSHAISWLIYLAPFMFAVIFDGVMTRKAKLASFRYTSPTVYNFSWHSIIGLFAVSAVAYALVTPLSLFFYPIVITLIGLLMRLLISNVQHSA